MILSKQQSKRFVRLYDSLIYFANEVLNVGACLNTPGSKVYQDPQEQIDVEKVLWNNPDVIDLFATKNSYGFSSADLREVISWKNALTGLYYTEQGQDGQTLMMSESGLFEVCGISREISSMLTRTPALCQATLLPFDGVVVYSTHIQEMPISIAPAMLDLFHADLEAGVKEGAAIATSARFIEIAPGAIEDRIQRQAHQMIEELEEDMAPEGDIPGFHRGVLAGMDYAQREKAIKSNLSSSIDMRESMIRDLKETMCESNSMSRKLSVHLSKFTKDSLVNYAKRLGMTRISQFKKAELQEAISQFFIENPGMVTASFYGMSHSLAVFMKKLYEHDGELVVPFDGDESLEPFLFLSSPHVATYKDKDAFVIVMLDVAKNACSHVDWDDLLHYLALKEEALTYIEFALDLRGVIDFNELESYYSGRYEEGINPDELYQILVDEAGKEMSGILLVKVARTTYVVHHELFNAMMEELAEEEISRDEEYPGDSAEVLSEGFLYLPYLPEVLVDILEERADKPACMPTDEMLECSIFIEWCCKQPAALSMTRFLDEHIPDDENEYYFADKTIEDLVMMAHHDYSPEEIIDYIEENNLVLPERQLKKFLNLLMNLVNTTPRWSNNGWGPMQLSAQMSGHPLFFNEDGGVKKIGRNEPCPCGSGKKYKRCCGA